MKICYVTFEFPPQFGGGIGTYVGNISTNLAKAGNEVHVVTFNPGDLKEYEEVNGVQVHRIKMNGSQMELINQAQPPTLSTLLYWSLYSEKVYRKLRELNLKCHFNMIEFADYRGEGYFSMIAKKTRHEFKNTALVVRMHTPLFVLNKYNDDLREPGTNQLELFESVSITMADYVVSPCRLMANLTNQELLLNTPIEILPHPIDFDSFPGSNYEESEKILYVGRLEKRKGVIEFIKAMIIFLPKHPKAVARLIGGDTNTAPDGGSMKEYLLRLVPNNLRKRVEFVNRLPREQVIQEYQSARFCVFPSLFENFPNVCLEAMSSGVPVVVSHFSGMAEMIEHGKSGLIYKSQDINDLVDKIEQLYVSIYDDRRKMGAEARKRVQLKYSPDVINELQRAFFDRISKNLPMESNHGNYEKGKVSVVIPCFNHGKYLNETIQSVSNNSYKNVEILIVNDGSTDKETLKILEQLSSRGINVIHQENGGLSAARNTGIHRSVGEYILPLDADDMIEPTFLEKTVKLLETNHSLGFVYTNVKYFGASEGVWVTPEFDPNLLLVSNLCVATSLIRHIAFDQIGGFKTDMLYGFEDWDFWIYMVEQGWSAQKIDEPLFLYRQHKESMLSNSQRNRSFLIEKLIEHHEDSYSRALQYVLVEKDRQFFEAHMSSYFNYKELGEFRNSLLGKGFRLIKKIKRKLFK